MFKRILVGSDGSECAQRAVRMAGELGLRYGSTLLVIHVLQPPVIPDPTGVGLVAFTSVAQEVYDSIRKKTAETLIGLDVNYSFLLSEGHPASLIIEAAKDENVDLVVMGSHGRGKFKSLLLGSVSDAVLHHVDGSVLIVR